MPKKTRKPPTPLEEAERRIAQARKAGDTDLDLSYLRLPALPESLGQLTRLRQLGLYGNQLMSLPESLGQLTDLEYLDLSGNQLTSLPESLGQLTRLQILDLERNQLTSLPESLGQLTRLERLFLSGNQLTSLPESLGQWTRLEYLFLSGNQLTSLPESLRRLKALWWLLLHGNDELRLPKEVLGPTWEDLVGRRPEPANPADILDYYFRVVGGRRPLNEAKLILVGHGAVGKTSLVNRLIYRRFDKDEGKTQGIQITQWEIRLNRREQVRLNVWDFGGQEIMHSTHQFFLTERSLYVLVLNGRQGHEEADAEYWLNLVQSFGKDSPVIVVLNKVKEQPFNLNRRGLQGKFPNVRRFVETDCSGRTKADPRGPIGIEDLRRAIHEETDRLEHLRDSFPAAWFKVKDRLAGMRRNYLTFDEYRRECAKHGEKDEKAQEDLAFYLHSLGIALNYKDDPRLQDKHVLNPHWVTNGIYRILNAERLAEQQGVLRLKDLAGILDRRTYPAAMHGFLLDLMRKFELCFGFPEGDERYLVPELLPREQPAEADEFPPGECLNFQYHYSTLPEGLVPRFVVRTHVLSTSGLRWRSGAILEFEGNRAVVKGDVQDKRVTIAVRGPSPGRRNLLAVIRSDFEHIHRSFKFEVREMVPVPEHPEVLVPYADLVVWAAERRLTYPVRVGDGIRDLRVLDLLEGVDLKRPRAPGRRPMLEPRRRRVRLFFSYSHKDEDLRNELETHLKIFQRLELIEPWNDRRILPGDEWKGRIDENLESADVVLLLVSADFVASDYCYDKEMKRALQRHKSGKARVIPVIVRDCTWRRAPFGKLQALPTDGKPVRTWPDRDTAWRNVAEGIEKVIGEVRRKLARRVALAACQPVHDAPRSKVQ